ncbi:beta-sarcoglycan [Agrilus planipennis]|uniref:Beta-sarcoglycan n=1 Tax=Agrilus planipennis TaxID=224129 RepID=A0A1W4WLV6_AGRPL|nr:beta-sarcoglycan [Agrilus planipennis]
MSEFPDGGSPSSTVLLESADSLSFRDKALTKRSISKHHNNNFKAGYVPVHEQYLKKTGLRGRKTFAFWTLVFLLCVLAMGNFILTLSILGVLRLGQGMQSLELVPDESTVKFFGDADLDQLYKRDGRLEGFKDSPIEISGDGGPVILTIIPKLRRSFNKLIMNNTGTYFKHFNNFRVTHGLNSIFSLTDPQFNIVSDMGNLQTKITETNRVVSPIDRSLNIEGKKIELKGAEGIDVEGKEIIWTADQNVYLKSVNGSVIMSSNEGLFVDVKKIPLANTKHNGHVTAQYKLCVCMPEGKLFRLPVPNNPNIKVYCNQINWAEGQNLCM